MSRLRVSWREKQLIVAEKSLAAIAARYEPMKKMTRHFAGVAIPREELSATFRRGWDAGCEKGPDEVAAMKAWVDYAEKSLQRARELHERGGESLTSVLEKEAELAIARSNDENREARLRRCREVLFPSPEDIRGIEPDP